MARRGPKIKPAVLKLLEGNPGKRPIPKHEPSPPSEMPTPPAVLDEYALEKWYEVAPGLVALGILAKIDADLLAAYCSSYSRWRHAEEEIQLLTKSGGTIAGLVLKTISGNWIQQPLIGIANKAKGDFVRFGDYLGLGETARARLGIDRMKGEQGKFKGLIGGKK